MHRKAPWITFVYNCPSPPPSPHLLSPFTMFCRGARSLERPTASHVSNSEPLMRPRSLIWHSLTRFNPFKSRKSQARRDVSREDVKEWTRNALSVVRTVSGVVGEAAGDAAPGLKIALAALETILEKLEVSDA